MAIDHKFVELAADVLAVMKSNKMYCVASYLTCFLLQIVDWSPVVRYTGPVALVAYVEVTLEYNLSCSIPAVVRD